MKLAQTIAVGLLLAALGCEPHRVRRVSISVDKGCSDNCSVGYTTCLDRAEVEEIDRCADDHYTCVSACPSARVPGSAPDKGIETVKSKDVKVEKDKDVKWIPLRHDFWRRDNNK